MPPITAPEKAAPPNRLAIAFPAFGSVTRFMAFHFVNLTIQQLFKISEIWSSGKKGNFALN